MAEPDRRAGRGGNRCDRAVGDAAVEKFLGGQSVVWHRSRAFSEDGRPYGDLRARRHRGGASTQRVCDSGSAGAVRTLHGSHSGDRLRGDPCALARTPALLWSRAHVRMTVRILAHWTCMCATEWPSRFRVRQIMRLPPEFCAPRSRATPNAPTTRI